MLTSDLLVFRKQIVEQALPSFVPMVAGNVSVALKARAAAPSRSRPVTAWLDALESDPAFAADMAEARKDLAAEGAVTLQTLRLRAGLSQQHLATAIGTTQANISRIERGEQAPSFATAAALGRALDVSLDVLAGAMGVA